MDAERANPHVPDHDDAGAVSNCPYGTSHGRIASRSQGGIGESRDDDDSKKCQPKLIFVLEAIVSRKAVSALVFD